MSKVGSERRLNNADDVNENDLIRFQEIYRTRTGRELGRDEALPEALRLLGFVEALMGHVDDSCGADVSSGNGNGG